MDNPSSNDIRVSKGSNSYFRVCFVSYIQIVLQSIGYRFAFRVVVIVCSPFRQTDFSLWSVGCDSYIADIYCQELIQLRLYQYIR